ncbi:membrane protein [Lysinibacillus xylanilyticus]|uniref:Membrane protein n=1 Tax=Lysinibacillus xylanilyticus TaxID=582475 RepID=A0A0K9FBU4_9BACI|nr:EamA family transporter [Lysinibacillus xylanilyticus]KMY31935.1 membrane protein [Lysinibacillus xylanilyticus]
MENNNKNQSRNMYLLMLLVPLFWGGAFATAKHVITEVPPLVAATLRFGITGIILVIITTIQKEWLWQVIRNRWKGLLFIGFVGIFGYNAFFFTALKYTSATNGALIIAALPVFTMLGAVIFGKEKWNNKAGTGLALSMIGVIIVIVKGSLSDLFSLAFNLGDLLFVGALLCGVIYALMGESMLKSIPVILSNTIMMLSGAVFLAISTVFEGGWSQVVSMSVQSWIEMFYMVVCGTLIGYVIFNKGVESLGGSKASLYLNLTPIVATLLAVIAYGSSITLIQIVGMVMVLVGVYIATNKTDQSNKARS